MKPNDSANQRTQDCQHIHFSREYRLVGASSEWDRDTGLDSVFQNNGIK